MNSSAGLMRCILGGWVALAAVALASGQVFYVGNSGDGTISKVDLAGNVTTYATGFTNPYGLAVDAGGTLYVSSTTTHKVYSVSSSGTVTDYATAFAGTSNLLGMTFDTSGNLYVADVSVGVYKVLPGGSSVSLWATGMSYPRDVAFNDAGVLYAVGGYNPMSMYSIASDGTATLFASQAATAGFTCIDFDSTGKAYVGASNGTYYTITPGGVVNTYLVQTVADVVYAGNGTFYFLAGNTLYRDIAGSISTFATGFNNPTSLAMATAVPEPATTAALLGLAVLGGVLLARRRAA